MWSRIVKIAANAAKKSKMDQASCNLLCSQLLKYKNNDPPYNQPYTDLDNPLDWWISMEVEPPYLQRLAIQMFSICPNSASCERGFSTCGWLSNKRRLRLSVEKLESMLKLITYYRSNSSQELGFYGKGYKENSLKLSDDELNAIVNESIAGPPNDDDDDDDDEIINEIRRTTDGHIIPNNEVVIWIEKTLDINDKEILKGLGELPNDELADNDDDDNSLDLNKTREEIEEEEEEGKGIMDFDVDELARKYTNE